jgi:hypothetical protein
MMNNVAMDIVVDCFSRHDLQKSLGEKELSLWVFLKLLKSIQN